MLGPEDQAEASGGAGDFFSALGTEVKRKDPNEKKPDPGSVRCDAINRFRRQLTAAQVVHSKYELNTQLLEGKVVDEYKTEGWSRRVGSSDPQRRRRLSPVGPDISGG